MNTLTNAKVLVIGGAGFIGCHVVGALLKTDVGQVIVYDNFSRGKRDNLTPYTEDPRLSLYQNGADIRDVDLLDDAMRGCDYVFHLAAMWLLHCKDFPRTAFHVNIEGTFNVLEVCVKNNIKCLVYSSSASVYGDAVEVPMLENHPFMNRNFYGASKIAGEAMCRAFHDRYGLPYVGLRYMNVYGPNQDQRAAYTGVIPILLNKIDANETPTVNGDGTQSYDFIYVEDVARANVLALQSGMSDRLYNVGTGVGTSIKDLCQMILKLRDSRLTINYQPYRSDDARCFVQNRIGCPQKAAVELGFRYQYGLREGLKKLIAWRDSGQMPLLSN